MDDQGKTIRGNDGTIPATNGTATERVEFGPYIGPANPFGTGTISSGFDDVKLTPLKTDTVFELNGKSYKYIRTLSEATAEAQIFLVKSGNEQFVLKRYYPFVKPKEDLLKKLRAIQHPDILRVLDFGTIGGDFAELQEYAAGGSLEARMPIQDMKRLKTIVREIVNALHFCHEQGIVHRDVKPSNIFCRKPDGTDIVLGDFGISSIRADGGDLRRTSMFQTPHYAAPEQHQIVAGKSLLSKAVDYYALGLTLLHLYTARTPFDKIEDELSIRMIKLEGAVPIPPEVPEELRTLIRGLTVPTMSHRWVHADVQKWLKGETVAVHDESEVFAYKTFKFGTDGDGNKLVARNPQELAHLMAAYPDIGRKNLYRGAIGRWLQESDNQELFVEVGDIVDYAYPDNEQAGTQLAIFVLDPEFPYKAVDGSECRTKKDLLRALGKNAPRYQEVLANPDDSFYLFLTAHGGRKEADLFRGFFKMYPAEIAVFHIFYSLGYAIDKNLPIVLRGGDNSSGTPGLSAHSPEEISQALLDDPDASASRLYSGEIAAWLSYRDPAMAASIEAAVNEFKGSDRQAGTKLASFLLNSQRPFIAPNGTECRTKVEIGNAINTDPDGFLPLLKSPNSVFYVWLLSRGLKGEVAHFRNLFARGLAQGKVSPWNDMIIVYKIVDGLDATPTFVSNGAVLRSPDDLANAEPATRRALALQLEDKNSKLNAWLSIFFHENPLSSDRKTFKHVTDNYVGRLKAYFEFLGTIDAQNSLWKRYLEAAKRVDRVARRHRRADKRFVFEWLTALTAPVLLSTAILLISVFTKGLPLPGSVFSAGFGYYLFMIIVTTVAGFLAMFFEEDQTGATVDFESGCMGGPVLGLIVGVVFYFILKFLFSYPIILGVLLAFMCWITVKSIRRLPSYSSEELRAQLFGPTVLGGNAIEQFRYAFGEEKKFTSPLEAAFADYKDARGSMRRKMWKRSGPVSFFLACLLAYIVNLAGDKPAPAVLPVQQKPTVVADSTAQQRQTTKTTNSKRKGKSAAITLNPKTTKP